jgi:hypothetical protein
MNLETILYYLFIFVMLLSTTQALVIGSLFFLKRSGDKRANAFFGLLLITFGLTLLHNLLTLIGLFERFPTLLFLPIYFTLAFPPLLFYHVKFALYPNYQLRLTDLKHFILPLMQLLFFITLFLCPIEYKSQIGRRFLNPFFGAAEQALYISTFLAYLYFAYKYIRQKKQESSRKSSLRLVAYLSYLLKCFGILFGIHLVFVIADFIYYEFFGINIRILKPYTALGALSFAALVDWLGIYGFQVLFWGRKIFK